MGKRDMEEKSGKRMRGFVDQIQQARLARGLSIRGLADQVGVSFSVMARYERGEGSPSPHTRLKLQAWLNGNPGALVCLCRRCTKEKYLPRGWQCPICAYVYAPSVLQCAKCNGVSGLREGPGANPFFGL